MKIFNVLGCAAFSIALLTGCKQGSNESKQQADSQDSLLHSNKEVSSAQASGVIEKATFQIEGMTCAMGCAQTIENKLAKMEGVSHAKVDYETKTATVEFDNGLQNPVQIKETVEKIANGAYQVENMTTNKESAMVFQEKKQSKKAACCSKDSKKEGKSCKEGHEKTTTAKASKSGSCCSKGDKAPKAA